MNAPGAAIVYALGTMRRKLFSSVIAVLLLGGGVANAKPKAKAKPKTPSAQVVKKPTMPPVSAEHKKALAELLGAFKFGMTKDEVIGVLTKQLDDTSAEKITATSDIHTQDNLRAEKKDRIAEVTKTFVEFNGQKTGWDVSIIDDQFARNTNESMLVYWENSGGKNQRRFFFFYDGKLWKMFVSLDVSILPRTNETSIRSARRWKASTAAATSTPARSNGTPASSTRVRSTGFATTTRSASRSRIRA